MINLQQYSPSLAFFVTGVTDLLGYNDNLGEQENVDVTKWSHTVSLYPDIINYKIGSFGNQESVTVTTWLYSVSLTGVTVSEY